jgi:streptogramin lyase
LIFGSVVGPDGNLWFVELSNIEGFFSLQEISPAGQVTPIYPFAGLDFRPGNLVRGPDKTVWVIERSNGDQLGTKIGYFPSPGILTEFSLAPVGTSVSSITAGPDGNLWFTGYQGATPSTRTGFIGRFTPTGAVTTFSQGAWLPGAIVLGPDHALWFNESTSDRSHFQLARFVVST